MLLILVLNQNQNPNPNPKFVYYMKFDAVYSFILAWVVSSKQPLNYLG